jgi:hypothetical protein
MVLHVATGYRRDEQNRLVAINDWVQRPVPRFWLGRTEDSVVWFFRHDLPDSICDELDSVCRRERPCDTAAGSVEVDTYQTILDRHGLSTTPWRGPVFWFASKLEVRGTAIPVSSINEYLLCDDLSSWSPDVPHQQPMMVVVEDGKAISVCASVRKSATAHAAGVETSAAYRGRGHAIDAVVGWVMAVQEMGLIALYSTSWTNLASQRLAVRSGAAQLGEELHFT